jgi:hypothetical protein
MPASCLSRLPWLRLLCMVPSNPLGLCRNTMTSCSSFQLQTVGIAIRSSKACEYCRRSKRRCQPPFSCSSCIKSDLRCVVRDKARLSNLLSIHQCWCALTALAIPLRLPRKRVLIYDYHHHKSRRPSISVNFSSIVLVAHFIPRERAERVFSFFPRTGEVESVHALIRQIARQIGRQAVKVVHDDCPIA